MLVWVTIAGIGDLLNKKGMEEEGMHFSTGNMVLLILFILLVALAIVLILPKLTAGATEKTLYNFGSGIFETLSGE